MPSPSLALDQLLNVVQQRRTEKVMAREGQNCQLDFRSPEFTAQNALVARCIAGAGWAPFHYARNVAGLAEPWRVVWLQQPRCTALAAELPQLVPDLKPGNRLAALLQACGSLLLIYWLPETAPGHDDVDKRLARNEEHLMAAAAYTQTLLLLATAAGLGTYWSSGTLLRAPALQAALDIPADQRLMAAVFVDYASSLQQRPVDRAGGALRELRGDWQRWCRVLSS